MPQLPGTFNPNDHEEMADFSAMPIDWYPAEIEKSEKLESKTKGNFYWKLTIKIISGKYKGRKVWTNLNLINKNPEAVEIAQRELTSICKSVGSGPVQATEELHARPFMVKLGIEPATPKYPEKNTVTGYKRMEGIEMPSSPVETDEDEGDADQQVQMPWDEEADDTTVDDDIPF